MYRYLGKNKKLTAGYVIMAVSSSVMGTGFAFLLSHMLDLVQIGTEKQIAVFLGFGCTYVIVMVAAEALTSLAKYKVLEIASVHLKGDVFCQAMDEDVEEFERRNSSFFLNQLTVKSDMCTNLFFKNLLELPVLIGAFVSAVLACIYFSPMMLLLMLGFAFLTVLLVRKPGKRVENSAKALSGELPVYTARCKDYLEGFRLIKCFLAEKSFCEEHQKENARLEALRYHNHRDMILAMYTGEITGVISTVVITGAAAILAVRGAMSAGAVLALAQLIGKIISPISAFVDMSVQFKGVKPVLKELEEVLVLKESENVRLSDTLKEEKRKKKNLKKQKTMKNRNKDKSGNDPRIQKEELPAEQGKIMANPVDRTRRSETVLYEIRNLRFQYPESGASVYNGVNLTIERGKKYLITGESGAGKSTLFALLLGFYVPSEGEIRFCGRDLGTLRHKDIYEKTGYLQQNAVLFEDSLRNNICLYKKYGDEEIRRVIRQTGLEEFVRGLPSGLDTTIGEAGKNLSGGEKQRICLARMLLLDREILLLDELETGIDEGTKALIEDTVLHMKGKTLLAISHDLSMEHRRKYDVVLEVGDGMIREAV